MPPLRVETTRGPLVESVHRVSVAVVDETGRLVASAGDPGLITFWRSAAKPFQAMPLLADGTAEHFGLTDAELALACASHSSETEHLAAVDRFLAKIGIPEERLACGPHAPLSPAVADDVLRRGITMTPRWSNCSGKHAGFLAMAKHHGWPLDGYQRAGHPLQDRLLREVAEWTSTPADRVVLAVDGCTTVSYGLPLTAMARAYARFGVSQSDAARRLWHAIVTNPLLIAGRGRVCTEAMQAWPGEIVAKIGADGIYSAAIPRLRLGLALKIEDGDMRSSGVALLTVVRELCVRFAESSGVAAMDALSHASRVPILSTRGEPLGLIRGAGELAFS